MKLTAKLKGWLVKNASVAEGSTDEQFTKAAAGALAEGTLTPEVFSQLSITEEEAEVTEFKNFMTEVRGLLKGLSEKPEGGEKDPEGSEKKTTPSTKATTPDTKKTPSRLEKMLMSVGTQMVGSVEDDEKSVDVRVKEAAEGYSSTKSALVYPTETKRNKPHSLAGQPVLDGATGRVLETASERDKAIAGAWGKMLVNTARLRSKSLAFNQLPQHDKELICYALENERWGGSTDGGDFADIKDRKLLPSEQKALIDDATSGGIEAAPIVFDDQIISTPLLNGELYPLVNVVPLDRGRRVEGVVTGVVTSSWGGVDDTAITLFSTASYVSAFDTTIFRWEGAIKIGLDFLSDTPIDFGQHLTSQYGERLLEDLDDVIATGDGTTQPEGVTVKTGATSVAWGGATSLGNYESLRFGVPKNEHRQNLVRSAVFIGNETSYTRARAIPVGASDARRLGGMDYSSYMWMERPYKINESMANTKVAYVILARYRMYRRRGLTIRTSTEGDTLIRGNEMLMVATARYGGQLERGAVCARTTTAPA